MTTARDTGRDRAASGASSGATARGFERTALRLPPGALFQLLRDTVGTQGELWVPVSGFSMYPTIRPGDRVLLSPVRAALVRGDVVIVPLGRSVLLHRVVSLTNGSALTMGDACKMPDRPIDVDSVFARAVAIRRETAVTALTPTLRFGVWALCRFAMSEVRRRAAAARGRLGAWRRKG